MKPFPFKVIAGRPVEVHPQPIKAPERETPLQAARRRHGKKFAFEPGAQFTWSSGPTVLDAWKNEQINQRAKKGTT